MTTRNTNVRNLVIALCVLASMVLCTLSAMMSFPTTQAAAPSFPYAGAGDCYAAWTSTHTYSKDQNTDHCTYDSGKVIETMHKARPVAQWVVVVDVPEARDTVITTIEQPAPVVVVVPVVVITSETCNNANPGNHKCVGNAGEDPNGKGTMDDDAPVTGNGEHGNQGTNTNGAEHGKGKNK